MDFKKNTKPKNKEKNQKILLKVYMHFLMVEKWFLMVLKVECFQ